MPSISVGDQPSVEETTIPMSYGIVSEGGKDPSTEVDWPSICLDKLAQLHENRWEVPYKSPIIFDLGSWWKEHYPNKARNALDADDKDCRQKNEENLWAYVVIEEKPPLQLI